MVDCDFEPTHALLAVTEEVTGSNLLTRRSVCGLVLWNVACLCPRAIAPDHELLADKGGELESFAIVGSITCAGKMLANADLPPVPTQNCADFG